MALQIGDDDVALGGLPRCGERLTAGTDANTDLHLSLACGRADHESGHAALIDLPYKSYLVDVWRAERVALHDAVRRSLASSWGAVDVGPNRLEEMKR